MTMMVLDKTWIYSFGGASLYIDHTGDSNGFEVERLNTRLIDSENKDAKWERFFFKGDTLRCCQQGVILLNQSWANEQIGQEGKRRFLVFGGVFNDYIDQVFVFNENLKDLSKSNISDFKHGKSLPFKDKFYYQQMFKITELPSQIKQEVKKNNNLTQKEKQYSENMIVYTGRKGLHIFDIDRENWIFNSSEKGYNYQDIYYKARGESPNASETSEDEKDNNSDEDGSQSSHTEEIDSDDHPEDIDSTAVLNSNNNNSSFSLSEVINDLLLKIQTQIKDMCLLHKQMFGI